MRETWVQFLGWKDLLEKEMATHSSILAWKIPWMEEPGRLQSMGLQRVGQDWATSLDISVHMLINLCSSRSQPSWDIVKGVGNKPKWFQLKVPWVDNFKNIDQCLKRISKSFFTPSPKFSEHVTHQYTNGSSSWHQYFCFLLFIIVVSTCNLLASVFGKLRVSLPLARWGQCRSPFLLTSPKKSYSLSLTFLICKQK